ncbi:hypothetical protein GCM10027290_35080 [Micromonospora sonneratiae]|uniref:Copper(I)-binding protein n=1 Tax=Micromonospora sonneratiae TaxID=1184706 RepID=A0ABW3YB00_9ACTN
MTRSIRGARRAAVLLAGTAATALLMSGCGAGQIAETARKAPSINGINAQTENGTFKVRNLAVSYLDPKGYPAGGNAPLEVVLYNDSDQSVTVTVTTDSANSVVLTDPSATPSVPVAPTETAAPTGTAEPSGSATPEPPAGTESPSGSPSPVETTPAAPAETPASIEIPARSFVVLNKTAGRHFQVNGLRSALSSGGSINLVFNFGGQHLETVVPVALPLTPGPVATPLVHDEEGKGHG